MLTARSGDRRVQRTHYTLRNALIELVIEHGWDAVTVQQVCERADVGRSTFYVHFADKEDLLLSGFDDLHAGMAAHAQTSSRPFAFAEPLLAHVAGNVNVFRALVGRQSGQQMQWRFRDVVRALIDEELTDSALPKAVRTRTVQFVAGGFVEMLLMWLDDLGSASSDEVAMSFRRLGLAAIEAARSDVNGR